MQNGTTTLRELLSTLPDLDADLTIYSSESPTPGSPAIAKLEPKSGDLSDEASGLVYLLEVFLAKEVESVWRDRRGGRRPSPDELCEAVILRPTDLQAPPADTQDPLRWALHLALAAYLLGPIDGVDESLGFGLREFALNVLDHRPTLPDRHLRVKARCLSPAVRDPTHHPRIRVSGPKRLNPVPPRFTESRQVAAQVDPMVTQMRNRPALG